jgi:Asp/Glu/hydantoin racemase
MAVTIYCVHTVRGLDERMDSLIREAIPGDVKVLHIIDEGLIRRVLAEGGLNKAVRRRFFDNVIAAEEAGADIVQVTCSSVTPAIACVRQLVDIPVFSIDEPMARRAVSEHGRIGVMATNPGTLNPSNELLHSVAEVMDKKVEIEPVLCKGAYEALLGGDKERHDEIVRDYFRKLEDRVEAVVLAQASMARIIDSMEGEERSIPTYTSPGLAVDALAQFIRNSKEYRT